jgi:hypothetical protein
MTFNEEIHSICTVIKLIFDKSNLASKVLKYKCRQASSGPEDVGGMFLWNVGINPQVHTVL